MQYTVVPSLLPSFGSIVGTNIDPFGFTRHVGILVAQQQWGAAVISFTRQGKIIQTVEEFTRERNFDSVEYPSVLSPETVTWRAQTAVISGRYNILNFNCDYFARYCYDMPLESPQAQRAAIFGLLAMGAAAIAMASKT